MVQTVAVVETMVVIVAFRLLEVSHMLVSDMESRGRGRH